MTGQINQQILISGAGIAGLTAALALAQQGFTVRIMEKASMLSEVGAGVQLAPNATRVLQKLGVLDDLRPYTVQPQALYLMDGRKGKPLVRMPLGDEAVTRWQAPYFTCHRADLQAALVRAVHNNPAITLQLGVNVLSREETQNGVVVRVDNRDQIEEHSGILLLACDGVWSAQRSQHGQAPKGPVLNDNSDRARFTDHIAWRATVSAEAVPAAFLKALNNECAVSAWLGTGAHLVAYPLKGGKAYNFVAITDGEDIGTSWDLKGDPTALLRAYKGWSEVLTELLTALPDWSFWPLFEMPQLRLVMSKHMVLLGDASHAMTPFAAQGAAMAIEDAASIAAHLAQNRHDIGAALSAFEQQRLIRLRKVAQRGKLNRFAYHANGPIAFGRNLLFKLRKPEDFLHDLDWLYHYDATRTTE